MLTGLYFLENVIKKLWAIIGEALSSLGATADDQNTIQRYRL